MKNYSKHIDTSEFISQLNKNSDKAFQALYYLYFDKLLVISEGYVVCKENAKGIVQNVFLKLWENKHLLSNVKNINNYLFTTTKNACLDALKHEKVKYTYTKEQYKTQSAIQYNYAKDEAAALLIEHELEETILKSIELLPEKCRKVFILKKEKGLKHAEIANLLGISKKTVDNHVFNALKHMRIHLKEFLYLLFFIFI